MISTTLRRELLERFADDSVLRPSVCNNRFQWSHEEHLRFHEALLVLPDDCTWQDVANFVGTKTRTQTLSRALSLHRRYAGIGRVRPRRIDPRGQRAAKPVQPYILRMASGSAMATPRVPILPCNQTAATASGLAVERVHRMGFERNEIKIVVDEVPDYLIPCVIDEISAFLAVCPASLQTHFATTESDFFGETRTTDATDVFPVTCGAVDEATRVNELDDQTMEELLSYFERTGVFSNNSILVNDELEPI